MWSFVLFSAAYLPSSTPYIPVCCSQWGIDFSFTTLRSRCGSVTPSVTLGSLAYFSFFFSTPSFGVVFFFISFISLCCPQGCQAPIPTAIGKWSLPTPQETDAYPSLLSSSLPPPSVRFAHCTLGV